MVKHEDVTVKLTGTDGNASAIIGAVNEAIRKGVSREAAADWTKAAMDCESYDALLVLAMDTVNVR